MLEFLITVVKLLVILGVVATIHEFGHFLFSKLFKVGVNEFSVGFGPKIVQKKYKETIYSLRWIPLGGYCAIEGEEGVSTKENSLTNKNLIQKILIFVMGAGFNAILAFIIFFSLSFVSDTATTKITEFYEDSVLQQAGLQVGDEIYKINGTRVKTLSEILTYKADENDLKGIEIEYIRDGKKNKVTVNNAVKQVGYIGASFKTDGKNYENKIEMVASGGAAFEAGLKAGDKIVKVGEIDTPTSIDVVSEIQKYANKEIEITIQRDEETLTKNIKPGLRNNFDLQIVATEIVKTNIYYAFVNTFDNFKSIVGSYADLFTGKVGIKDMSGIVGIGELVSKSNGFLEFINLMAIISLAVGVANILPFPPLDGGKIVIAIGEAITKKKMSEKVELIISYIGFGLLILLTVIVTYRDIIRII